MTSPESRPTAALLRRTFAGLEFVAAGLLVLLGADSATARRVGGDGIGTGMAHVFGPVMIVVGLATAYAAYAAWKGSPRWWVRQFSMLVLSVTVVLATFIFMVETI